MRVHWYFAVLRKYAVFAGRARRKEFWFFVLFDIIVTVGLVFVDKLAGTELTVPGRDVGMIGVIYSILVLLPSIAVTVRRLHDTDRSGVWFLIIIIPLLGPLILLVMNLQRGTSGPNRFGAGPTSPAGAPIPASSDIQ